MSNRIDRYSTLMDIAEVWAKRSTCERAKVGCVIAKTGRTIASGYNGAPAGMAHCNHECVDLFGCMTVTRLDGPEGIRHDSNCPAGRPCKVAVHAEANAIAFAARYGLSTLGAELYTTLCPCYECAKLIINAGIQMVVFRKEYRDPAGYSLLKGAKVEVRYLA